MTRNQSASDANAGLIRAAVQTDTTAQHVRPSKNGTLYFDRPVDAYADAIEPMVLLAARLVAVNGADMTRKELIKYLKDARKHGLA